jgi:L-alanine-DL-glutamate epimerase-like enolase superfamily enzyme
MRIIRLEAWPQSFALAEPYTIAYETVERVTIIFVRLVTDGGIAGSGSAAPDLAVTGEDAESCLRVLEDSAAPLVEGEDPLRWNRLIELAEGPLAAFPSARAALDMALHDIVGKIARMPLWKLLGGYRDRITTSVTIGILPADRTVAAAKDRVAQGFRALKLKGGRDVEDDIERVRRVREAIGPAVEIRFDANQGYTVAAARRFVLETATADVEILEQPTPREEYERLGEVTRAVAIDVMADESLMTLRDAFHLAQGSLVDRINIKLMKVGGITEALDILAVARAAKFATMVGCMDECGLSIAAGLAFALARAGVTHADLDGHLDLIADPTASAVTLRDGVLYPSELPGLGVELEA